MASRKIEDLVTALQFAYTDACNSWATLYPERPEPFLTCTHRDNEEQEILYMRDKNRRDDDGDGLIDERDEWRSNAKPGQSKHNKYPAEALDIAFKDANGKLDWSEYLFKDFAVLMKRNPSITWGGDWAKRRDTPHFEIKEIWV